MVTMCPNIQCYTTHGFKHGCPYRGQYGISKRFTLEVQTMDRDLGVWTISRQHLPLSLGGQESNGSQAATSYSGPGSVIQKREYALVLTVCLWKERRPKGFGKAGLKHRREGRRQSCNFTVGQRIWRTLICITNKDIRMLAGSIKVPALFPSLEDIKFHCFCLIWNEPKLRHKLWRVFWKLTLPKLRCKFHKREKNRRH